jgi:hypothetical protein
MIKYIKSIIDDFARSCYEESVKRQNNDSGIRLNIENDGWSVDPSSIATSKKAREDAKILNDFIKKMQAQETNQPS